MCGFGKRTEKFRAISFVFSDDLIILGSALLGVKWVKEKIGFLFNMKDLGELRHYLGISFERSGNVMFLHQGANCNRVPKRIVLALAKLAPTPMIETINDLFGAFCC